MSVWCDRTVTGGILFLILFTPFAFGSVHPWAFSIMEALIFLLVVVWMTKIIIVRGKGLGVTGLERLTPYDRRLTPDVISCSSAFSNDTPAAPFPPCSFAADA